MNILVVEDQRSKSHDIVEFLNGYFSSIPVIREQQSLRAGLKDLVNNSHDLIILDMSMPNFDPSDDDHIGGTPESFAGKEFLSQMDLRDLCVPVVVVTQYSTFAKGQIALEDLDSFFNLKYPAFYKGAVYYSSSNDSWKLKLEKILKGIEFHDK